MKLTLPDRTRLDAARETYGKADKELRAAGKAYDAALTRRLNKITLDDIETYDDIVLITKLAYNNRRAYDLLNEWVNALGSTNLRAQGAGVERDGEVVGPSVTITVPRDEGTDADREALAGAIEKYLTALEPILATESIGIQIMDNDLSRSGVPYLIARDDGLFEVSTIVYGSARHEWGQGTLREAIAWIARNRWYGDPHPSADDDDDNWRL